MKEWMLAVSATSLISSKGTMRLLSPSAMFSAMLHLKSTVSWETTAVWERSHCMFSSHTSTPSSSCRRRLETSLVRSSSRVILHLVVFTHKHIITRSLGIQAILRSIHCQSMVHKSPTGQERSAASSLKVYVDSKHTLLEMTTEIGVYLVLCLEVNCKTINLPLGCSNTPSLISNKRVGTH